MAQITVLVLMALAAVAISAPRQCICPMIFAPVCASNGQVFSNRCLLKCHNVETNENLEVVAASQCKQLMPPALQMYREVVESVAGCACSHEFIPVCGTDIKTYFNSCVFNCAAKKDSSLGLLYPRRCHFLS